MDAANGENEGEGTRQRWGSKTEFFLTLVGYAVGIGNVWRFPYLCYMNGGAAFLIPYLIILLTLGIPIFTLELMTGQRYQKSSLAVWPSIDKYFQGIGWSSFLVNVYVNIYYNIIVSWCFAYLFFSFESPLPWKRETDSSGNVTMDGEIFFYGNQMLNRSRDISQPGGVPWRLGLCLTLAWVTVYAIIYKGIESSGKVVYFTATFPYFVLLIMVITGCSLPGAADGLKYYLIPDASKLGDSMVWVKAAEQVFYSLGVGYGTHTSFASFNPRNHDCFLDAMTIPWINAGTSFFAGFAVFSTLGYLAKQQNTDVADLSTGGFGLAFIAYPEALERMPASNFFSFLFFFMLLLLAIDSQFAMTETVIVSINDLKHILLPKWICDHPRQKDIVTITVCVVSYLIGFGFVCRAGYYVISVIDGLTTGFALLSVAAAQMICMVVNEGPEKFINNFLEIEGNDDKRIRYAKFLNFTRFMWTYITPYLALALALATIIVLCSSESFDSYICNTDDVPESECEKSRWAISLGLFFCFFAFLPIPIGAFIQLYREKFLGISDNAEFHSGISLTTKSGSFSPIHTMSPGTVV